MKLDSQKLPRLIGGGLLILVTSVGYFSLLGSRANRAEASRPLAQNTTYFAYMPFIMVPLPGLSGYATFDGVSAPNLPVSLRVVNSVTTTVVATTMTASDGGYSFASVPSLLPGERYNAQWTSAPGSVGELKSWTTQSISSYSTGQLFRLGDFDIGTIPIVAPTPGATVVLPFSFQWTVRSFASGDSYELYLRDPISGNSWGSGPLGYVGSYMLTSRPTGFLPGVQYNWQVKAHGQSGGVGITNSQKVTFGN